MTSQPSPANAPPPVASGVGSRGPTGRRQPIPVCPLRFPWNCGIICMVMGALLTARITAIVLLAAFLCASRALAVWRCEGRVCGVSLAYCCCTAPESERDENCGLAPQTSSETTCPSNCVCTLTLQTVPPGLAHPDQAASHDAPPALFPLLRLAPQPLREHFAGHAIELRGPPTRSAAHATIGPRAPPTA